ncbi:uncharacterized protein LOC118463872 isoform X3 [Anopheles albimanus]|uniref:uncharacterized protein LOC118463872 isoform X3 n=1 Tax=Anopheles albimanus TaxID=7167 RepID=UPI00163F2043|nr:uncharacterized protein LOC118463872 isoform X3 [Anopheles albimanus]
MVTFLQSRTVWTAGMTSPVSLIHFVLGILIKQWHGNKNSMERPAIETFGVHQDVGPQVSIACEANQVLQQSFSKRTMCNVAPATICS